VQFVLPHMLLKEDQEHLASIPHIQFDYELCSLLLRAQMLFLLLIEDIWFDFGIVFSFFHLVFLMPKENTDQIINSVLLFQDLLAPL
jgi:hypothetical protein